MDIIGFAIQVSMDGGLHKYKIICDDDASCHLMKDISKPSNLDFSRTISSTVYVLMMITGEISRGFKSQQLH